MYRYLQKKANLVARKNKRMLPIVGRSILCYEVGEPDRPGIIIPEVHVTERNQPCCREESNDSLLQKHPPELDEEFPLLPRRKIRRKR